MPDKNVTIDYDSEPLVPRPASSVIRQYLGRSLSMAELFKRALRGWFLGVVGLGVGLVAGIYTVSTTPPRYSVDIGLLPTESAGSDLGESGALGALAGLVGISSGPVPKFTRFVSSLYATGVAEVMDRKFDMVCRTYRQCDRKTHAWHKPTGPQAWFSRTIAHMGHLPDPDRKMTPYDLAQYTKSNVAFSSDKTTHILTLSMDTTDPKFASVFLNSLVDAGNEYIKNQDRSVIQQYVNYLYAKLATNTNVSQRDALSSLVLEQERHLMLTSVNVPYAALVQDGPNVSESNAPARTLIIDSLLGAIFGAGLGVLLSFIPKGSAWRRPLWRRY